MANLVDLEEALNAMKVKPDMLVFDACKMLTNETKATLKRAGVRWLHASDQLIDGVGLEYRSWLRDMSDEIDRNGELRMSTSDEINSWFRDRAWYADYDYRWLRRPDMQYDGDLVDTSEYDEN